MKYCLGIIWVGNVCADTPAVLICHFIWAVLMSSECICLPVENDFTRSAFMVTASDLVLLVNLMTKYWDRQIPGRLLYVGGSWEAFRFHRLPLACMVNCCGSLTWQHVELLHVWICNGVFTWINWNVGVLIIAFLLLESGLIFTLSYLQYHWSILRELSAKNSTYVNLCLTNRYMTLVQSVFEFKSILIHRNPKW